MIGLNEAFSSDSPSPDVAVLPEYLHDLFRKDGLLQSKFSLEYREEQEIMVSAISEAWLQDQPLLFEAGTGVGKSLAYLIPSIIHSIKEKRPAIISTHTIALQEQIEKVELPLCRKIFSKLPTFKPFREFKLAVLLGKGNYLCGTRLNQAIQTRTELFPAPEQEELIRISNWAEESQFGLRHELNPPPMASVWDWVNADGSACNNRNCNHQTCFYRKAKKAIREANVIIVNHSLLFSLLGAGFFPKGEVAGILFPEDFVVLDEAHTVPEIATDYFGSQVSRIGLKRQLSKLYNPKRRPQRGLLKKFGNPGLIAQVQRVAMLADTFFDQINRQFLLKTKQFRLQKADWMENPLDIPLRDLISGLEKCESQLDEGAGRDELNGLRQVLQSYRETIRDSISLSDPGSVYWLEKSGSQDQNTTLTSAPLDVAPLLRERLFARDTGILLTSATLADGESMDTFKKRVGAEQVHAKKVLSPFDYALQTRIFIATDSPEPTAESARLDDGFLSKWIEHCSLAVSGGTLVLFTSYQDMYRVERTIRTSIESSKRKLLCQGIDGSRSRLVEIMKHEGNAILFGTDSFWTGVDIPGPALSQVILTRLPFSNPSHPVLQARSEDFRKRGLHPFSEIMLPDAVIKFRQGWGRLIRRQTDSGTLTILDSRILTKPYGKIFLNELPHAKWFKLNTHDLNSQFIPLEG